MSDTRAEAYNDIEESGKAKVIRARVYGKLRDIYPRGLTCEELAEELKIIESSVRPRCSELRYDIKIMDSGARRENSIGKNMIVWKIVLTNEEIAKAEKALIKGMKPIGNKLLFGKMMQSIYAFAHDPSTANRAKMGRATNYWSGKTAAEIGGHEYNEEG